MKHKTNIHAHGNVFNLFLFHEITAKQCYNVDQHLILVVISRISADLGDVLERKCTADGLLKLDRAREEEWSFRGAKYSHKNNLSWSEVIEWRRPLYCSKSGEHRFLWICNIISTLSLRYSWSSICMMLHVLLWQMLCISNQISCRVKINNLLKFYNQSCSLFSGYYSEKDVVKTQCHKWCLPIYCRSLLK